MTSISSRGIGSQRPAVPSANSLYAGGRQVAGEIEVETVKPTASYWPTCVESGRVLKEKDDHLQHAFYQPLQPAVHLGILGLALAAAGLMVVDPSKAPEVVHGDPDRRALCAGARRPVHARCGPAGARPARRPSPQRRGCRGAGADQYRGVRQDGHPDHAGVGTGFVWKDRRLGPEERAVIAAAASPRTRWSARIVAFLGSGSTCNGPACRPRTGFLRPRGAGWKVGPMDTPCFGIRLGRGSLRNRGEL